MDLTEAKNRVIRAIENNATGLNLSSYADEKKLTDDDLIKLLPDLLKLKSLTSLYLSANQISDYSFLKELTGLTILYLSRNQISDVSFLKELKGLTELDLSDNQISDASFFKELTGLTILYLSRNQISDVSFLKELKGLTELYLSDNQISDYSFLKERKELTILDLSHNQISDYSFLKELKELKALYLSRNQISDVSFLKELKGLTGLDLSHNQISDVSFLKELKELKALYFIGNPNLNLPENLKGGFNLNRNEIDNIIAYYEQLKEGEDYIYEAKVLIVGEPKAGKTTLFKKLQNPEYLPQEATEEEKESTIGVQIEILEFPYNDEKNFKAHLWDFGGQEKQYVLHQYFFTERSLYVLLTDDRKESGNFNYWFEIIATLGTGCPVLVVLNEINSKVTNFDISVYKREFGRKILDIEEKSVNFAANADGRFTNLANEIKTKLKNLQHIGQPLPATWVKVRKELTEIKEPIIGIDGYYAICEKSGIDKPEYRSQILEYLHDLGIALNYKNDDNLRHKLILKPNWVIDALYVVLKDKEIINRAGKFSCDEVFELWKDYKTDEKMILLQLMQKGKFEVAYKLTNQNAYIAPILLTEIAPDYVFDETDSLQIHFEYAFMPKGIIPRLIVRFHENIISQNDRQIVWKKGVLLQYKNSVARIIESEQQRKITITVSGRHSIENREFITIIRNEIKGIHRDWFENRLKFEERVPCYCDVCKEDSEPNFYALETVESYYEINQEIVCDKSVKAKRLQRVNPRRLLEGVYIEEARKEGDFMKGNTFNIAGNLNMSNISGNNNISLQDIQNSEINLREKLIDEIAPKVNETQKQELEQMADKIISHIETKELAKLDNKEKENLEEAKKGKWETKFKYVLPLIPKIPFLGETLPSASIEGSRTITAEEFVSGLRKKLYGDDLQLNILQEKNDSTKLLDE